MSDLATEDILGVELVRAGGPFRGQGSPAGGDYITTEQLGQAVASFNELRDELWPPVKLGHNNAQAALRHDGHVHEGAPPNPGLFDTDGAPAAGWLDNLRVEGGRLLADMRKVPATVAALVRAGAYRARSIEFWRGYTDASGKRHPFVVTGVALLGAKLPAVRGLKDLVTLYGEAGDRLVGLAQDDGAPVVYLSDAGRRAFAVSDAYLPMADPDRTWDEAAARSRVMAWAGATDGPTDGTDAEPLSEAVLARLRSAYLWWSDGGGQSIADFRYLVADVVDGALRAVPSAVYQAAGALTQEGLSEPDLGRVRNRLGAFYAQLGATPPWGGAQGPDMVPDLEGYADAESDQRETEGTMPQTITPELASALGVPEDADAATVQAKVTELAEKAGQVEDLTTKLGEATQRVTDLEASASEGERKFADELEALRGLAEQGVKANATLFALERDRAIDTAISERRLTPGERDTWVTKFDAAPDVVSDLLAALPVRSDLSAGESGDDSKGDDARKQALSEDAEYERAYGEKPRFSAAVGQEA